MCLIILAYQPANSEYELIVTANREEYYVRPTATAYQWEEEKDTQHIIAGRDLQEGGTWLGIDTRRKRFAALTNNFLVVTQQEQEQEQEKKERHIQQQQQEKEQEVFDYNHNNNNNNHSKQNTKVQKRSRGELVTNFLTSNDSAIQYSHTISKLDYRGYSLLLMDETGMYCVDNNNNTNNANSMQSSPFNTNKQQQPQPQPHCLVPGKVYGLTNRQLNCDWPKNIRGRKKLETWLEKNHTTTNDNKNHHNRQNDNSHNNNKNHNNSENSIPENEKKNNTQNKDHDNDEIIDTDVDKSNNNSTSSIHELHQILFHPTMNNSKNPNNATKEEETYNYPDRIATDAFLTSEYYGTRVNTVVVMKSNGEIFFSEQGFGSKGVPTQTVQFSIPA